MKYIRVFWKHALGSQPVELLSELDEERFETRKIEISADGRWGFASNTESVGDTRLGTEPLPSLERIAADPQFQPEEISEDYFDELWSQCNQNSGD